MSRLAILMSNAVVIAGFAAILLLAAPGRGIAAEFRTGSLVIELPWARATAPTAAAGAAFLSIRNEGDTPDRLVSVDSPAAERAELHTHVSENGVMRMRRVPAIDIAANATTSMEPGGFHVMLLGLRTPLVEGTSFPLTLSFDTSGTVDIVVPVLGAGASTPVHQRRDHVQ